MADTEKKEEYPRMWLFQRKHISDPVQKDYLIKRAYVEFITPTGETQIGINPRFNEHDEDEFRLQDKCIYSRGQPSQTKISRKILLYIFTVLAILNIFVVIGLVLQTFYVHPYSEYQQVLSIVICCVTVFLTLYGIYSMRVQSLTNLTVYVVLNLGISIITFPLSPTPLYFVHFIFELILIYLGYQMKYRLDDLWFIPSSNDMSGQLLF